MKRRGTGLRFLALSSVVMAVVSSEPALAGSYAFIKADKDSSIFLDLDTVSTVGLRKVFWLAVIDRDPEGPIASSAQVKTSVDCKARRLKIESLNLYKEDGELLLQRAGRNWEEIIPESVGDNERKTACFGKPWNGGHTLNVDLQTLVVTTRQMYKEGKLP